eukprot:1836409-Rhodomonas_salina.1
MGGGAEVREGLDLCCVKSEHRRHGGLCPEQNASIRCVESGVSNSSPWREPPTAVLGGQAVPTKTLSRKCRHRRAAASPPNLQNP